jgi:hypothetical protein
MNSAKAFNAFYYDLKEKTVNQLFAVSTDKNVDTLLYHFILEHLYNIYGVIGRDTANKCYHDGKTVEDISEASYIDGVYIIKPYDHTFHLYEKISTEVNQSTWTKTSVQNVVSTNHIATLSIIETNSTDNTLLEFTVQYIRKIYGDEQADNALQYYNEKKSFDDIKNDLTIEQGVFIFDHEDELHTYEKSYSSEDKGWFMANIVKIAKMDKLFVFKTQIQTVTNEITEPVDELPVEPTPIAEPTSEQPSISIQVMSPQSDSTNPPNLENPTAMGESLATVPLGLAPIRLETLTPSKTTSPINDVTTPIRDQTADIQQVVFGQKLNIYEKTLDIKRKIKINGKSSPQKKKTIYGVTSQVIIPDSHKKCEPSTVDTMDISEDIYPLNPDLDSSIFGSITATPPLYPAMTDHDILAKLVDLLNPERTRIWKDWLMIAQLIKYTIPSKIYAEPHETSAKLFEIFNNFSKKTGEKYNLDVCREMWASITGNQFTGNQIAKSLGTLHVWASIDSPVEYQKLKKDIIGSVLISGLGTALDNILCTIFQKLGFAKYCSLPSQSNTLYEYTGNLYKLVNKDKVLISVQEEIIGMFLEIYDEIYHAAYHEHEVDKVLLDKAVKISAIITSLTKDTASFKKEFNHLSTFVDVNLISLMNANPSIIGFNNVIYDINTSSIYTGTYENPVSFTTGYDFEDYSNKTGSLTPIYKILHDLMPNKETRNYTLKLFANSLLGTNNSNYYMHLVPTDQNQQYNIFDNFNGLIELVVLSFGDYAAYMNMKDLIVLQEKEKWAVMNLNKRLILSYDIERTTFADLDKDVDALREFTDGQTLYDMMFISIQPTRFIPDLKTFSVAQIDKIVTNESYTVDIGIQQAFMWILLNEYLNNKSNITVPKCFTTPDQTNSLAKFVDNCIVQTEDNDMAIDLTVLFEEFKKWAQNDNHQNDNQITVDDLTKYLIQRGYFVCDNTVYGIKIKVAKSDGIQYGATSYYI